MTARNDETFWLAEFVVREAVHLIDRQEGELDEMRRRALSMLAASALAASVVGAVGISKFDATAKLLFVFGLVAFLAATALVIRLQLAVHEWVSGFSPSRFLDQLDKLSSLGPSEVLFKAARFLSDGADKNMGKMASRRKVLAWSLACGAATVFFLLAATAWTVFV